MFSSKHISPIEVERQKRQFHSAEDKRRVKRQTTDPDQLCPTVATYISPQAAVNSKGWCRN